MYLRKGTALGRRTITMTVETGRERQDCYVRMDAAVRAGEKLFPNLGIAIELLH